MAPQYIQSEGEASLTYERVAELLAYNPETGELTRLIGPGRGRVIKSMDSQGYLRVWIDGRYYQVHRVAWFLTHREWPKSLLDHHDRNKTHNVLSNLRPATFLQNSQNMKILPRHNTSGFRGVIVRNGKIIATIKINKKRTYLGTFATKELAYAAYVEAARRYHGAFATVPPTT